MITAVIAGNKTFQIRVFADIDITPQVEIGLTDRLCTLMNNYQSRWQKLVPLNKLLQSKD